MKSPLSAQDIRQKFINYFQAQQHEIVPSSSLIPGNDPTLLFVNAGMVQFKDVFLGHEKKPYKRATSIQRCVRAGGKHNDLENVGFTARHHTFFEMLGNFSFGDYFKREAIEFAWRFLTEELGIPQEKLWVTVYKDDPEAERIWLKEMKVSAERFSRCGAKDNFWSMGDTGPCGPCTEIFYDHGENIPGGPPGSPDEDGDRYIEIWNLVFMQFNRNEKGELTDLPKPSVDTGMGLERIAAVMQGVHTNYDTDEFKILIQAAAQLANTTDLKAQSLKVLADHIRSTSFLIIDGVRPSNEGRGYVLRRIIRRAIRHGHKLGIREAFFSKLVPSLVKAMGRAYPELSEHAKMIEAVLQKEEKQFAETLDNGLKHLEDAINSAKNNTIPGEVAFKLYDTFGFPLDLTADIAREKNLVIDEAGFNEAMSEQRKRSQSSQQFKMSGEDYPVNHVTQFTGYEFTKEKVEVLNIFKDSEELEKARQDDEVVIVLASTPFYAESGGQVGDTGFMKSEDGAQIIRIVGTQKQANTFLHYGLVEKGSIAKGDVLIAEVDSVKRAATKLNHSATHLLHAALREILGHHVVQKGSLVTEDRLRFDFSHDEGLNRALLFKIERRVNEVIRHNQLIETIETDAKSATEMGAMALFGEKYGDTVRVLKMGDFSIELCGGTHAKRTGDIGLFKIISEAGIAAGVRRIEAITGEGALKFVADEENALFEAAQQLKTSPSQLNSKVEELKEQVKQLEKALKQLKAEAAEKAAGNVSEQAVNIQGSNVLACIIEGADMKSLRDLIDKFKQQLDPAIIVLGARDAEKAFLIAGVSQSLTKQVKAGELIAMVAAKVDGKGGGRPGLAQAGGTSPEKLDDAIASVLPWVKEKLGA